MTGMRALPTMVLALLSWPHDSTGQATTNVAVETEAGSPPTAPKEDPKRWDFSASVSTYVVPDSREYVQPTFTADRDWLHLEARYNYEALETGSAWIGYNFSVGDTLTFAVTPMLGGVFGETFGIAPGYLASLGWWKLELSTEGEFMFDVGSSEDGFFYAWSELTLAPTDWLRLGLAVQRTKLYQTDFDVQRGFVVGFNYRWADLAAYVFNPDDEPTFVVAVEVRF